MTLSEELQWRGMIKDKTFDDVAWLDTPRKFYLGADCQSADSLTIGNLAVYMLARTLAKHGWQAVLLVGGATSLIGDPGGKDEERQLKSKEEIDHNVAGIKTQVGKLFAGKPFELVNNYDWFKDIGYLAFLRDVGKHYSMTELVQRDFIATRMNEGGAGISYAEFSYNLIQGYDFWWLFKNKGVELQIGGSDQWGNMLSGAPLIRKKEGKEVHALSMPLVINKATGKKFGKSEEGAVWLDEHKTSVYKFYQFWLNVDDEGAEEYLKRYTLLDKAAITTVLEQFERDRSGRLAQKTLAYEVTAIVHGAEKAAAARSVTEVLFGQRDFADLTAADHRMLKGELPVIKLAKGDSLATALVQTSLAGSRSEAVRFIASGAVAVNGRKAAPDIATPFQPGDNLIKRGKNSFAVIEW